MMFSKFASLALGGFLLASSALASPESYFDATDEASTSRELTGGGRSRGRGGRCRRNQKLALEVINLTRAQPFAGSFFVLIHNGRADPLFELNMPATPQLATLAEDGNPGPLEMLYKNMDGVAYAGRSTGPASPGAPPLYIDIDAVSPRYPYVTIAAMFVNSNDGFAAINGKIVRRGDVLYLNGMDAGSEDNTENCSDIPGPACPENSGNASPDEPETTRFVRVHSGFFGEGTDGILTAPRYDWRNPMLRVEVMCVDEDMLASRDDSSDD